MVSATGAAALLARATTAVRRVVRSCNVSTGLAVAREQHQIRFPVSWLLASRSLCGSFLDGETLLDMIDRRATPASPPAALAFSTR